MGLEGGVGDEGVVGGVPMELMAFESCVCDVCL